jgi:hypothetical protein
VFFDTRKDIGIFMEIGITEEVEKAVQKMKNSNL